MKSNMAYIYKITNTINNKAYVGVTATTVKSRWNRHCSDAQHNRDNQAIHAAMRKYGKDKFKIEILEQHDDVDHAFNVLEPRYIQEHNTLGENGYNMTQGGEGWLNMRHRPESIEKMRLRKTGKRATDQAKKNMSTARKGCVPWNKGKKCPQISAAKSGKLLSDQHRQSLSESHRGKKKNNQTKQKISDKNSNRHRLIDTSTGEIYEIKNLRQFCKKNNLGIGNLLYDGKTKNFKMLESYKSIKTYNIKHIDSDQTHTTQNLKQFCKNHNVSNAGLLSKHKQKKPYLGYQIIDIVVKEHVKKYL